MEPDKLKDNIIVLVRSADTLTDYRLLDLIYKLLVKLLRH